MNFNKILISILILIGSKAALAFSVDDITKWSELGTTEIDYLEVANNLGIENVELLDMEDPQFTLLMDTIREKSKEAPANPKLDGKSVSMLGFIAPLEIDETHIQSFLLVPYEGACIHMPPPPQNNVVYIQLTEETKIPIEYYYEAIIVEGTLKIKHNSTALADSTYVIDVANIGIAPMEAVFQVQ